MTPEEGMQRLAFHTLPEEGSFLEMLRPYRGVREDVLDDVMRALRGCAPMLVADHPPRALVSSLWAISHLGRSWALDPGGMLRRNQLIGDADQTRLAGFLDDLDRAVLMLLEGVPAEEVFAASEPGGRAAKGDDPPRRD